MMLDEGHLLDEAGHDSTPADTLPAVAGWLLAHMPALRMHEAAGDAVGEICSSYRDAVRAIDRPADRYFLGTCGATAEQRAGAVPLAPPTGAASLTGPSEPALDPSQVCAVPLWGSQGQAQARCRGCGTRWDARARREALAAELYDTLAERLLTASEAAIAIGVLRHGVDSAALTQRVRMWATSRHGKRPRLQVRGHSLQGRPLYRYGDVIDLYDQSWNARQRPA
jgi:hypothetical protein